MRRSRRPRRRISPPADRARPPRRGVRAARGSGRGAQARLKERRAARRDPPRDAGHIDRGHAARCRPQQLSARGGPCTILFRRQCPVRARLDRYLDRRIPRDRMRPRFAVRRNRAARAKRNHRLRRAVQRSRPRRLLALASRRGAARPRRVRQRHRRAPARVLLRGRDQRGLRSAVAPGTHCRRGLRHLCRAHAARQAPATVAALARSGLRQHGDRPGDARQSRTDAHAWRRPARLIARFDRPHGDRRRLAHDGAAPVGAADRSRADCQKARCGRGLCRRHGGARRNPLALAGGARSRPRVVAAGGWPRRPARSCRHPRWRPGGGRPRPLARFIQGGAGGNRRSRADVPPPRRHAGRRTCRRAGGGTARVQARRRLRARGI